MPIPGSVLNSIINPGLAAAISAAYSSSATLLVLTITTDTTGQQLHTFAPSGTWANLPCRKSPLIEIRPQDQENREENIQRVAAKFQLNFTQQITIPDAALLTYQIQVDGITYQILSVEIDGSLFATRLMIGEMNPFNG